MNTWILTGDQFPTEGQSVIYFFEDVGVHRGKFDWVMIDDGTYRDKEVKVDCFYGKSGFLTRDVTHWMPDEGQELPPNPY